MSIYIEDKNGKRRKFAGVGSEKDYIDDKIASEKMTWSSEKILDTLCPPFTETGNPITCNPVEDYPLDVTVTMEPIQAGEGDPSPDNVRPISGRDEVKVTRCGKNLLKLTGRTIVDIPSDFQTASESTKYPVGEGYMYVGVTRNGYWTPANIGEYEITENSVRLIDVALSSGYGIGMCIKIVPGASYVISTEADDSLGVMGGLVTKKDGLISRFSVFNTELNNNDNKFTAQEDEAWAIIVFTPPVNTLVTYYNTQLELGSTPTPYEPYQPGTTAQLTLPETIYGGTVDAATGVGSNETIMFELAVADMNNEENYPGWRAVPYLTDIVGAEHNGGINDEILKTCNIVKSALNDTGVSYIAINTVGTNSVLYLTKTAFGLTQTQWKEQYPDLVIQVCLKRISPEPFQATGNRPLSALPGTNTLYTDGNSLTVSGSTSPISAIESFKADVQASANQAEAVANILLGGA